MISLSVEVVSASTMCTDVMAVFTVEMAPMKSAVCIHILHKFTALLVIWFCDWLA